MVAAHDVPDLEPLEAPQTLEERRARQRLHVKRTYYKKLMEMQTLRDTVEQLEAEFARLELKKRSRDQRPESPASTADLMPSSEASELMSSDEYEAAKHRFNEIVALKARLREENEALQQAIAEHNRFGLKAASWIRVGHLLPPDDENTMRQPEPVMAPLMLSASVNADMCREIARQTFQGVRQFTANLAFLSTGVSLFGWRDKRIRTDNRVAFSLTKEFKNITALELWRRSWQVTGATNGLSRLYSASMNVSVASVQRVDDDNEIKLRVMTSPDGSTLVKTLFLISRFAMPNGYAYIIRALDPAKYIVDFEQTRAGVAEHWVDYHNWTIFETLGENGEHCRLEFGGEVLSNAVAGSDMWMLEVLLVALRWESIVIEPVFKICPNEGSEDV